MNNFDLANIHTRIQMSFALTLIALFLGIIVFRQISPKEKR